MIDHRNQMDSWFFDSTDYFLDHNYQIGLHNCSLFAEGSCFGFKCFDLGGHPTVKDLLIKKMVQLNRVDVNYIPQDKRYISFSSWMVNLYNEDKYIYEKGFKIVNPFKEGMNLHIKEKAGNPILKGFPSEIPDSCFSLNLCGTDVDRIKNIPSNIKTLNLTGTRVKEIPDFTISEEKNQEKVVFYLIGLDLDQDWLDYVSLKMADKNLTIFHCSRDEMIECYFDTMEREKKGKPTRKSPGKSEKYPDFDLADWKLEEYSDL